MAQPRHPVSSLLPPLTLDAHEGTRRCHGHTVLSGTRLGNQPRLVKALGQQHLPQRVVDLVRPRVRKVLALQPDLGSAWTAIISPQYNPAEKQTSLIPMASVSRWHFHNGVGPPT